MELKKLNEELVTKLRKKRNDLTVQKDDLKSQGVSAKRLTENVNQSKEDILQSHGKMRKAVVGMLDGISDQLDENNEKILKLLNHN